MGSYDAIFDASNITPQQAGGKHPVGNKFPFVITDTDVKDTKDNTGKFFSVTFTSPQGSITNNYNLWNSNAQAVDIAAKQLSALCHAIGIFQINMRDGGKNIRGAKGLMDIGHQAGQEPSAEKPEGGYVEVKKIYDANGNEPGKPAQQATPNGNWGNAQQAAPNPAPQQQQPQVQQGWNNAAPQQNPAPTGAGGGWTQGAGGEAPPWVNK